MKPFLGEGKPSTSEAGGSPLPNVARQSLAYRVFLRKTRAYSIRILSRYFRASKVFSKPHSARFRLSKELLLLSWNVFDLQKYFRAFPCAILAFKSTFIASPARFQRSKALFSFGSNKNQYIKEFLWQK
ncbi:MAG: hypothetical protein HDR36_01195 [Treponema sp.]|nr:hypothetical protein [Treponema sp.]